MNIKIGKNIARAQHSNILKSKKSRKAGYFRIKDSLEFSELCDAADYVEKNFKEQNQQPIFGNPLPNSYEFIGKTEEIFISKSFIKEINWILISLRKYHSYISRFLTLKDAFENSFFLGHYEQAEQILTSVENEVCFSMWTLENRFLLYEFKYSGTKNKELLIKFNGENKSKFLIKALAHYLSIRAEKTLSVNRFHADLENAISRIEPEISAINHDYYHFKLLFINSLHFEHYNEILGNDFGLSIVDKYLSLRKVLISLLAFENSFLEKREGNKGIKQFVISRINYILRKLDDPVLSKLKLFGNDKLFPAFDVLSSEKEVVIFDLFNSGKYDIVEEQTKNLLVKKPIQFDLYLLYVDSLVYQNKSFIPIYNIDCLQNQILKEIYIIVSLSGDPSEAGMNLLRIANNLSSSVLSYGITDFVMYQTKGQLERKKFARLSYNFANPNTYECYTEISDKIRYLELLQAKFPTSITTNFLIDSLINQNNLDSYKSFLPESRYLSVVAKRFYEAGEFEKAAAIWEKIIKEKSNIIPIIEPAIINLYKTYEQLKKFNECVNIYAKSFFINPFLVEKIETESLLKTIRQSRFKVVAPSLELAIFYTVVNADENEIHTTYERFNLMHNATKPSQLFRLFDDFRKDEFIFYLRYSCDPEILKHSIHIRGSKEKLEERLAICQFLEEKDKNNLLAYADEIKSIQNILIIQQGRIELDESKIYVNEQGILNNELKDFEAIYKRFITISNIAENRTILLLHKGMLTTVNYGDIQSENDQPEYSNDPVSDIYFELFDAVKDKFLYSKFGIVAYLSTRIRHGVLLGELRPIFEKHKLITQKEGDSTEYKRNEFWEAHFQQYTEIVRSRIQYVLRDFSDTVDGLIYDLIKKHLQVKDKLKSPEGWFDYAFDEKFLLIYSTRSFNKDDFGDFVKSIFDLLWERTDDNLNTIREKIQTVVANQFDDLFNKLESDIVENLPFGETDRSIITAIKSCSTDVQMAVQRISNWFKRSGSQISDFKLEDLIDIVVNYSDKSKRLTLTKDIQFEHIIKGEYYTHFADLLRIFIENILKHSNEYVTNIRTNISIKSHEGLMSIVVTNEITKMESIDALAEAKEDRKININKLIDEGKSGFHKALKILQSDLKNEKNAFGTVTALEKNEFNVYSKIYFQDLIK
jgi:hypothetical protein